MVILTAVYNFFSVLRGSNMLQKHLQKCGLQGLFNLPLQFRHLRHEIWQLFNSLITQETRAEWAIYRSKYNYPPEMRSALQD